METESTPGNVRLNDGLGPNAQAVERDTHRGGSSYEASMLRNLLARIHGDGGHYVELHGLDKAFEDADALVAALRAAGLAVVAHMVGRLPVRGWLRDNDKSRDALAELVRVLGA